MLQHYTPCENIITRLHPLVKVLLLCTTAIFAFMVSDIIILAAYLVVILMLIRIFQIKFGRALIVLKLFAMGIPMLMVLFVLSYLWKEPTYRMGAITGLLEGSRYSLRFLSLILMNFIIVLSTDPREMFYAFDALHLPDPISRIMAHVINLFPRLVQEIRIVFEAQTLRGMQWKNLWRPSSWMPLVLPVILASMRYSEQTAISIELRGGLDSPGAITPRFTIADSIASVLCVLIIIASILQYKMPV